MPQTIEVEYLKKIHFEPGDVLLIKMPASATPEMVQQTVDSVNAIRKHHSPQICCLILSHEIEISLIGPVKCPVI